MAHRLTNFTFLFLLVTVNAFAQIACPYAVKEQPEICTVWETQPLLLVKTEAGDTIEDARQKSEQALLQFIYNNLRMPLELRNACFSGTAVVSFYIDEHGIIDPESIRCVRDPGFGLGTESIRIANLMVDLGMRWQPATVAGKPVPVRFNLPVRFKLL